MTLSIYSLGERARSNVGNVLHCTRQHLIHWWRRVEWLLASPHRRERIMQRAEQRLARTDPGYAATLTRMTSPGS